MSVYFDTGTVSRLALFRSRSDLFVFFNDTATTEIYTLSLHDALPICRGRRGPRRGPARSRTGRRPPAGPRGRRWRRRPDRKSTRLNSSHANISYAVFCLKKKKIQDYTPHL